MSWADRARASTAQSGTRNGARRSTQKTPAAAASRSPAPVAPPGLDALQSIVGSSPTSGSSPAAKPTDTRFTFAMYSLVGQMVDVGLIDGSVYSGIFHTANMEDPKGLGVVLSMARVTTPPTTGKAPVLEPRNQIILQGKDVVFVNGTNVEFDDGSSRPAATAGGFATDTAISRDTVKNLVGRKLEKANAWVSSGPADALGGLEDGRTSRDWDQFEANQKLFKVKSGFDENMYTTPLDKASISTADKVRAARIAREIEKKSSRNPHVREERNGRFGSDNLTEEERYGSVVRGGRGSRNAARTRTSSRGGGGGGGGAATDGTYVPPFRRPAGEQDGASPQRGPGSGSTDGSTPAAGGTATTPTARPTSPPKVAVRAGQRVNKVAISSSDRRQQTEELRDFANTAIRARTPTAAASKSPAAAAAAASQAAAAASGAPAAAAAVTAPAAAAAAPAAAPAAAAPATAAKPRSKLKLNPDASSFTPKFGARRFGGGAAAAAAAPPPPMPVASAAMHMQPMAHPQHMPHMMMARGMARPHFPPQPMPHMIPRHYMMGAPAPGGFHPGMPRGQMMYGSMPVRMGPPAMPPTMVPGAPPRGRRPAKAVKDGKGHAPRGQQPHGHAGANQAQPPMGPRGHPMRAQVRAGAPPTPPQARPPPRGMK